ncbi:hypothetical protein DFH06DRAFT_1121441 [Mycena polygramma]|nr:hypothetical protein DFH06DRAFT_1121441 [Mycena polygramma]
MAALDGIGLLTLLSRSDGGGSGGRGGEKGSIRESGLVILRPESAELRWRAHWRRFGEEKDQTTKKRWRGAREATRRDEAWSWWWGGERRGINFRSTSGIMQKAVLSASTPMIKRNKNNNNIAGVVCGERRARGRRSKNLRYNTHITA